MEKPRIAGLAIFIAVTVAFGIFLVLYTPESFGGDSRYFIMDDSDENSPVKEGALFVTQDIEEIEEGKVVRFRSIYENKNLVGRVKSVDRSIVTIEGNWVVNESKILGEVKFSTPYLGYVMYKSGTPLAVVLILAAFGLLAYRFVVQREES